MVHGPKWQNSNKIIAGKPADATRANAVPFNVGSKKSGGVANRLLRAAQPHPRKTSSQPSAYHMAQPPPQPPPQPSCEYFFIKNNASGEFLDTVPEGGRCFFNTGTNTMDGYKVKLVSTGRENGSKYIVNREGKYMTVFHHLDGVGTGIGSGGSGDASWFVTFQGSPSSYQSYFIVNGTIGSINATIREMYGDPDTPSNYLTKNIEARFENVFNSLSFLPSASSNGC